MFPIDRKYIDNVGFRLQRTGVDTFVEVESGTEYIIIRLDAPIILIEEHE